MLAAHEMGPLILTLAGMVCATWLLWIILGFSSIARLSAIVVIAALAGLLATLVLVPVFASLVSRPEGDKPADAYDRATARNIQAIWNRLRPAFTALLLAVSLFCIVFFSSLNFSTAHLPGSDDAVTTAARGLQFTVEGEAAAEKLVEDLQRIPEVGTVRWMGNFQPQQVELKRKILQGLAGAIPGVSEGGAVGPYNLLDHMRGMEAGLRIISDGAGTDAGLRASALELRRALAVLANSGRPPEATTTELERLLFSGFDELSKNADGLAGLTEPKLADLDPNLRALYVTEGDRWRIEALPRRLISAKAFIDATRVVDAIALGPLVAEQAQLRTLSSASRTALTFGFVFTLLMTLAYLRNILDWLIVVASSFLLLPLYAVFIVTTATAISPATLPALVMTSLFGVTTALLLVTARRQPAAGGLAILLPVAAIVALILPIRLLNLPEYESFTGTLTMLLAVATAFNLTVVPQLCAWTEGWRSTGPAPDETKRPTRPREELGDDAF